MRDDLGGLGQIPLQVAGEPRAIIDNAEQNGRCPLAPLGEHLARAMVAVPMPQTIHILGLVAADLAIGNADLGTLGPVSAARRQTPALVEAVRLHEAAQRRVGRHRLQVGLRLAERDEVVMVKLDAPALVRGVLREHGASDRVADGVLQPRIDAHLASQDTDRIGALLQGAIVPALDGGEAEARGLARRRMLPCALS